MSVKKYYSNKKKTGWRDNPQYAPVKKLPAGAKQKEHQKKYYSWGYDVDLDPIEFRADGTPVRNRRREAGFASSRDAEAAAAKIKFSEKDGKYDLKKRKNIYPLLGEFFQKRINTIRQRQERVRAVRVLQSLLDALEENGFVNLRLDQLQTAHINLLVSRRKNDKYSGDAIKDETINRDLRTLRATLNQAVNLYPDLENYVAPKIPFLKTDKTRREKVLPAAEVQLIVNEFMKPRGERESQAKFLTRRRAGLLFALSAVTGARPGELVALREEDILEDIGSLKITGKKTRFRTAKTVRYFPLLDIVRQILAAALMIKIGEYIFSRKGTLTPSYYDNVAEACRRAGLKYGRRVTGGIIPYDLRHTATTLLMQSGADFETVKSLTGQSRHTLWHYTHASRDSINRAVTVLDNFAEKAFENSGVGRGLDTKEESENTSLIIAANKS
ncbi:MAG TPA: site-specific integrase [Pyrinomonadaceae bacterium]